MVIWVRLLECLFDYLAADQWFDYVVWLCWLIMLIMIWLCFSTMLFDHVVWLCSVCWFGYVVWLCRWWLENSLGTSCGSRGSSSRWWWRMRESPRFYRPSSRLASCIPSLLTYRAALVLRLHRWVVTPAGFYSTPSTLHVHGKIN